MKDTKMTVRDRLTGERHHDVVIKKGTVAFVDLLSIRAFLDFFVKGQPQLTDTPYEISDYNPRHFPEPGSFKPARWESESATDGDAFVGFGYGPRACIGRKFALVEGVCFLVMMLRDWRVEVDLVGDETPEEWRRRTFDEQIHAMKGLAPFPIRLSKRTVVVQSPAPSWAMDM